MPMFGFVCKNSHFLRKIVEIISLIVPRFACKAKWDSKSGTETTPRLILMPQIQWQSQNLETSFS